MIASATLRNAPFVALSAFICVDPRFSAFGVVNRYVFFIFWSVNSYLFSCPSSRRQAFARRHFFRAGSCTVCSAQKTSLGSPRSASVRAITAIERDTRPANSLVSADVTVTG